MTMNFHSQGSILLEGLMGVFITSLLLVTLFVVATQAVHISARSVTESQATFLLEEGVEVLKILRTEDWDTNIAELLTETTYYLDFSGGVWSITTLPATQGIFTRSFEVFPVYRDGNDDIASSGTLDPGTLRVQMSVSWQDKNTTTSNTFEWYLFDIATN